MEGHVEKHDAQAKIGKPQLRTRARKKRNEEKRNEMSRELVGWGEIPHYEKNCGRVAPTVWLVATFSSSSVNATRINIHGIAWHATTNISMFLCVEWRG